MKIDALISHFREKVDNKYEEKEDRKLILKHFFHQKKSDVLYVFFPQMEGYEKDSLNRKLRKVMKKRGYSFLEYSFSASLLDDNYKDVIKNFTSIKKDFSDELRRLKKDFKFKEINIIGISIGCVSACLAANNKDIQKLFLIIPGHCLAESLWNGIRTQHLKNRYEKQGFLLKKLKKGWRELAPENNIDKLKAKNVYVYLSKADVVIPYRFGNKLLEELKEKHYNVYSKINNNKGHYLTALNFYFHPKRYLFRG